MRSGRPRRSSPSRPGSCSPCGSRAPAAGDARTAAGVLAGDEGGSRLSLAGARPAKRRRHDGARRGLLAPDRGCPAARLLRGTAAARPPRRRAHGDQRRSRHRRACVRRRSVRASRGGARSMPRSSELRSPSSGWPFLPPLPALLAFGFAAGVTYGPINPIGNVALQERTPDRLRGRVLGLSTSIAYAAGPGWVSPRRTVDRQGSVSAGRSCSSPAVSSSSPWPPLPSAASRASTTSPDGDGADR